MTDMTKDQLRKIRNDMAFKLFTVADMSHREFATFWSLDHTQLTRIFQQNSTEEEED